MVLKHTLTGYSSITKTEIQMISTLRARYVLLLCFLGIIDTSRNQKPAVFSFFRFVQKNENQNLSLFIRFLVLLTKTSLPLNIWFPPVGGSSYWLACFIALCSS